MAYAVKFNRAWKDNKPNAAGVVREVEAGQVVSEDDGFTASELRSFITGGAAMLIEKGAPVEAETTKQRKGRRTTK